MGCQAWEPESNSGASPPSHSIPPEQFCWKGPPHTYLKFVYTTESSTPESLLPSKI